MQNIITSNIDQNTITSDESTYELSLRRTDFTDGKERFKFVKKVEMLIRSSPEYKEYISYIYDVMGVYKCQVTNELRNEVPTEIHHHPITLFNIVNGIVGRNIEQCKEFCSYDVALEAMEMHFKLQAPFVVLIESMHKKYHNGALQLPMELVQGDYNYFINNYGAYIPPDDLDDIYEKIKINKNNCGWSLDNYSWISYKKPLEEV